MHPTAYAVCGFLRPKTKDNTLRTLVHIDSRAYSRELLLLDLEALHFLQRESIKTGSTPSQIINDLVLKHQREAMAE